MDMQQKNTYFDTYNNNTHRIGRICVILILLILLAAPFAMGLVVDAAPDLKAFAMGFMSIAVIYIPSCIVEFLIYTPMLGAGGSYLAFITGNLINMKIPCAVNAREMTGAKVGTPENEIISTLSIATSSLVTTLVIAVGVLLIIPLQPILSSPALQPAFNNVIAALFGAMAYRYFRGGMKIAALPLITMTLLCVLVPSVISSVSFLIIPSGAMAIGIAFLIHKNQQKKELK